MSMVPAIVQKGRYSGSCAKCAPAAMYGTAGLAASAYFQAACHGSFLRGAWGPAVETAGNRQVNLDMCNSTYSAVYRQPVMCDY